MISVNIIDTYTQMLILIYIPNCIYNNIITMYVTCIYINLFAQMYVRILYCTWCMFLGFLFPNSLRTVLQCQYYDAI